MRVHDWEMRLAALFEQRRRAPFEWGSNDCCLFAADAVMAACDYDPAKDLRGTYATEAQGEALIASLGGLEAIASARVGEEIAPAFAQIGDVGTIEHNGKRFFAVWGGRAWHTPSTGGLVTFRSALRAWRADRG